MQSPKPVLGRQTCLPSKSLMLRPLSKMGRSLIFSETEVRLHGVWAPPAATVHVSMTMEATKLGVLVTLTPDPTFKICMVYT